jgi:hypothetical protein
MNQITPVMRARRPFFCTLTTCCLSFFFASASAQEDSDEDAEETSKPIVLKLDYRSNKCAAHLEIEYFQSGDNARVNASLSNADCAASSGEYTIQVRIRDADSQTQKLEFPETWSRDDNVTIVSARDYFIGDNVDLVRVNSRNLKCRCTEAVPEDGSEPADH